MEHVRSGHPDRALRLRKLLPPHVTSDYIDRIEEVKPINCYSNPFLSAMFFFVVLLQSERKIRDQAEVPSTTEVFAIQNTPDAVDPQTSSPASTPRKPGQSLCAYSNLTNSS